MPKKVEATDYVHQANPLQAVLSIAEEHEEIGSTTFKQSPMPRTCKASKERKKNAPPGATVKGDAFKDGADIEEDRKSNADKVTWVLIVIIGLVAAFALFVGLDGFGHNTQCGGGKGGFHCAREPVAKLNKPPNTPCAEEACTATDCCQATCESCDCVGAFGKVTEKTAEAVCAGTVCTPDYCCGGVAPTCGAFDCSDQTTNTISRSAETPCGTATCTVADCCKPP
jgi:hypothetical protein